MNIPQPLLLRKSLPRVKHNHGQPYSHREPEKQPSIYAVTPKHLLRPHSTPDDRSGEELVNTRTGIVVLLRGSADTRDLGHLIVEHGSSDKAANQGRDYLCRESAARWNLDVVGQFQVLGKVERVRARSRKT